MKKSQLVEIRSEIKSNEGESRGFNPLIRLASGSDRHLLRIQKKNLSYGTRIKLLVYGMLRNIPYTSIEKKTDRPPFHVDIFKEATRYCPGITEATCLEWMRSTSEVVL